MITRLKKYLELLKPYYDIILFVVALLAANFFWKFTVLGDEGGIQVTWFGMDITAPFDFMAAHIAHVVFWFIQLTNDTATFFEPSTIHFATGTGTRIVCGAMDPVAGAMGSIWAIHRHPVENKHVKLEAGCLEEACRAILQDFFKSRRGS